MDRPRIDAYVDVVIVGAGVSGLGAACHLQRECPDKEYVILEARHGIGGTWDLFRYPGIRSDSDLFTYGYEFKPWNGQPIATAPKILRYLQEVVDENNLAPNIRFGHRVTHAAWSTEDAHWLVEATNESGELRRFAAGFLLMCQGYYSYEGGHRPEFPGEETFKGPIIHPQKWPENLDYTGKRMVVIGSGATAATIVPAVAERVAHVTQLQRSPSYYLPVDNSADDALMTELRALDLPESWLYEIKRRKSLAEGRILTERALAEPNEVRQELLGMVADLLPAGYEIAPHFTPRYDPWKERLCLLPDGDLLRAVASGKASVVTDEIDCFVEEGIRLKSGQTLNADMIVTATGIELSGLGDIPFVIDGRPVDLPNTWTYKGIMISDMPNLAWIFGYIRSSWTLRSDLIAHYVCRLLQTMDEKGMRQCTPRLRPDDQTMKAKPFIDPADFAPGYMRRGAGRLPKQGDREPWTNIQNYYMEKESLLADGFEDGVLHFDNPVITYRFLTRSELELLHQIDRTETIECIYYHRDGQLILQDEHWDVSEWTAESKADRVAALQADHDRGATALGAFADSRLIGMAMVDHNFLPSGQRRLNLIGLWVSHGYRGMGVGRTLVEHAAGCARDLDAETLYVSATPSENTVRFYFSVGCRPTKNVDPDLFAKEPEDIHLELPL